MTAIVSLSSNLSGATAAPTLRASALAVGSSVDVKNRYIGTWSTGFEVAALVEDGYLIRRLSDRSILPGVLGLDEVRQR